MNAALLSSAKMDYLTPPEFLGRVRQVGPIGLDPCTSPDNPVGARRWIHPPQDGLSIGWSACIRVGEIAFVNPPYGRELSQWVNKCEQEAELGCEIVLLVPARTDTRWFPWGADRICFWRGRVTFMDAATGRPTECVNKKTGNSRVCPAAFPSAVCYFGGSTFRNFEAAFESAGVLR